MDFTELIKKHAVKNAIEYGKANPKAVIGKVLAENPSLRKNVKEISIEAVKVCNKINSMTKEELEHSYNSYDYIEIQKESGPSIHLPNAKEGHVTTRFLPEPSGYLHIGHAKAIFLAYKSAEMYKGNMILRFDDTNPKKESQEFVDSIRDDLTWLGVKWSKETYTSDRMDILYKYIKKMISEGNAYVCTETNERIKKMRRTKTPLPCRENNVEKNMELFDKMLENEFEEGEAVVLLKGDLESDNTAMRDPTMFRIITSEHYRQGDKYIVWPTYDFEVSLMDHYDEVTHAMRSKEYELRKELYYYILEKCGIPKEEWPHLLHFSRLSIKNVPVSKRFIKPLVESGIVDGWDDPRLPTIKGLKRRGIHPKAIEQFALRFGMGKQEKVVTWEFLLKENRKVLDPISKHIFFVEEPVEIKIDGLNKTVEIPFLPLDPTKGTRVLNINGKVYISKHDFNNIKDGEVIRLKDLCNIKVDKSNRAAECIGDEIKRDIKKIHWVGENNAKAKVIIPKELQNDDGSINKDSLKRVEGIIEDSIKNIKVGEVIQMERFGFSRLDGVENGVYVFIFSS